MSWGWRYSGPGIVLRVNICGGDVVDWHSREAVWYQGRTTDWSGWIGDLMRREGVTDLLAFGDWRPLHREAILVANCGISGCGHLRKGICGPIISRWKRAGSTATRCFPIRRPFCGNLRNPIRPCRPRCRTESSSARVWKAIAYYAGTIFCARFSLFPDASPAERRERSLGMVPSRPDPPHMGKAFGGERPGNLPVACALFPVSSPA